MKLEVGMYVRTEWGIGKYIKDYTNSQGLTWRVLKGCYNRDNQEDWEDLFTDSEILKASHNIIDLIEVGDYVNGYKITEIIDGVGKILKTEYKLNLNYVYFCFYERDIKSIVTKEQFEREEFKV